VEFGQYPFLIHPFMNNKLKPAAISLVLATLLLTALCSGCTSTGSGITSAPTLNGYISTGAGTKF
jgi:hypothetical protein